ncbi:DUF1842 domain-containing protein [Rubritalea marina]|uniref:DUF1842 domain-containing protein n=1 Tax=Rubritalea marina TaxID=361055 RepID=UPI000374A2A9|nr:DUF1842 domain-containing protein [Rubritalea marina]
MSTTTDPSASANKIGLYKVDLTAGNKGMPGAPILSLSLLVNAASGEVTGQGVISQAVESGDVKVSNITGKLRSTGFGEYTKVLALQGEGFVSFPPPAIGSYLAPFEAHFSLKNDWSGLGAWELKGSQPVEDVPCELADHD